MNWVDIVILVILFVGGFYGLKSGLIGASLSVIGIVGGVLLAGQLSDDVGELLTESISNDTIVTVVSYAIILGAVVVVTGIARRVLRTLISMVFLGWLDRLGGLALGVLAGAAISGALITGMARLTYNFELPSEGLPQQAVEEFLPVADAKGWLEDALAGSSLVPTFIDLTEALPADALGFVPSDFRVALDILQEKIQGNGAEDTTVADEGDEASDSDQQQSQVTLKKMTIDSATALKVSLSAIVEVDNPNPTRGTLKRLDFAITFLDGGTPYPLGSGTLSDIALEPRKKTEVELTLDFVPFEVVGASGIIERVSQNQIVPLLISGELTVDFSGQESKSTFTLSARIQ